MTRARAQAAGGTMPELNLTPMIDIVFQLIIFFMCAMKFKTLAMKIDMDLPNKYGLDPCQPVDDVDKVTVEVVLEQTDWEGIPHLRIFGKEIRPDLGRGIGPLPRISTLSTREERRVIAARHQAAWARNYAPKLVDLRERIRSFQEQDRDLRYLIAVSPRVKHAFVVGVVDTFLGVGIEQVDFRGTQGSAPGR